MKPRPSDAETRSVHLAFLKAEGRTSRLTGDPIAEFKKKKKKVLLIQSCVCTDREVLLVTYNLLNIIWDLRNRIFAYKLHSFVTINADSVPKNEHIAPSWFFSDF